MSSAFLPFALASDQLLSNAFLFLPRENKDQSRLDIDLSAQLFQLIPIALQSSSLEDGCALNSRWSYEHWLLCILPLPIHLNHVPNDDDLQQLLCSTLYETN
jgi:hypothetical protein